ncbi:RagB/SusD family nutrient uptake outer membrane protein [Pedobacter sp. MC2016-14]|uniref:RagB/SusD family nutrient uptake outer membrane protein n=1 Tax=Pedobacter sp. MC2016-14 TaxID=2897327 RepID=UPI001E3FB440|nr:RagB/SusD family nutrient uptake outer membrane protein [Pedobacter sp. MC2016-14]MCD0489806.1 RagB/SusD family nutrient uptake outer membrane protein [Pedobacter sp. MC2016-14]
MKLKDINLKKAATVFLLCSLLIIQGCKDAVNVPAPTNSLIGEAVYTNNKTATAVLTGIYSNMHSGLNMVDGNWGMSMLLGTAADEMKNYFIGIAATEFYTNNITPSSSSTYFWADCFKYIYVTNAAMEGVNKSETITPLVKRQLIGEAKFLRAFFNFYALNLFGSIPLVTSTDPKVNNVISRSSRAVVYRAIIADLLSAQELLTDNYMDAANASTTERIRPNKGAATALLARTYLYIGDWSNAEIQATALISNSNYSILTDINQVFLKNSQEAIWQLASSSPTVTNTLDAYNFVLQAAPGIRYHVTLNAYLLNAFEAGDNRKNNWVKSFEVGNTTYFHPYKYKNNLVGSAVTENVMVFRLGEQYLIRAEARAHLNDVVGAVADLNALRSRARASASVGIPDPLPALPQNISETALMQAILHERQIELFSEWGHRWFDLRRTNNLDAVMGGANGVTASKGGNWTSDDAWLPLPAAEIQANPNLVANPG